jgi:F0F1-type ATP synthase delta subunit
VVSATERTLSLMYARAFVGVYGRLVSCDDVGLLGDVYCAVKHNRLLRMLLTCARDDQESRRMLRVLSVRYALPAWYENLFMLLRKDNRLFLLAPVLEALIDEIKQVKCRMDFFVISAHILTQDQLDRIQRFLTRKTGLHVVLMPTVDKRLIGGLKVFSKKWLFEYTIMGAVRKVMRLLL